MEASPSFHEDIERQRAADLARWTDWYRGAVGHGAPEKCVVNPCCVRKDGPLCPQCAVLVHDARAKIEAAETMADLAALTCDHGVSVAVFCAECPPPTPGVVLAGAPVPFVRLRRGDDWGTIYFALEPRDARGMADHRRGIVTYEGDQVEVRWPTGETSSEVITMIHHEESVSDHGNTSVIASAIPCVRSVLRGKMGDVVVNTPLDEVDVRESWVTARQRRDG